MLVQKKMNGGKERNADTFIAGLLAGYAVSDRTNVNEQVSFSTLPCVCRVPWG
jgi:peroxisomal membrane protein 4